MHTRRCEKKDIQAILELGKKACHERGWVDVDWSDLHFYTMVKNIMVNQNTMTFGLFEDDLMIGFICAQLHINPWNSRPECHVDLMHIHTTHRNHYQELLNAVYEECNRLKITTIKTSQGSFLLDKQQCEYLLVKNGFAIADIHWEKKSGD
jgi:N-acetylglutamate synthase-like GNAT family acetyltransferase